MARQRAIGSLKLSKKWKSTTTSQVLHRVDTTSIGGKWDHGPHALVRIRNELVHPEGRLGPISLSTRLEAQCLGLHYVELMLLNLTGYYSKYLNRLKRGYSSQLVCCWGVDTKKERLKVVAETKRPRRLAESKFRSSLCGQDLAVKVVCPRLQVRPPLLLVFSAIVDLLNGGPDLVGEDHLAASRASIP